MQGLKVKVAC